MTTGPAPMCMNCKNYDWDNKYEGLCCEVFPERILDDIIFWRHDHRKPYPGDKGIRYDPINPNDPLTEPTLNDGLEYDRNNFLKVLREGLFDILDLHWLRSYDE